MLIRLTRVRFNVIIETSFHCLTAVPLRYRVVQLEQHGGGGGLRLFFYCRSEVEDLDDVHDDLSLHDRSDAWKVRSKNRAEYLKYLRAVPLRRGSDLDYLDDLDGL